MKQRKRNLVGIGLGNEGIKNLPFLKSGFNEAKKRCKPLSKGEGLGRGCNKTRRPYPHRTPHRHWCNRPNRRIYVADFYTQSSSKGK